MTQGIHDFIDDTRDLVGLGEPEHRHSAFGQARNAVIARLVERGFRSIALETDRTAALVVDGFVRRGTGTLDTAMREGFSHGFGDCDANRDLVAWMREYNTDRPAEDRLAFHGIDAPLEFTAASPRRSLEAARDYLGLDVDIRALTGDDERWSSAEAVMDPAASPGDDAAAHRLRAVADDMLTALYARAPELVAATSRTHWDRARIRLLAALGLLRYHRQAAQPLEPADRWSRLSATRDALMAQNLLDIRAAECPRGPTVVAAHNVHLQLSVSRMTMAGMDLAWSGTGAIAASLLGGRYAFIAGVLVSDMEIEPGSPPPGADAGPPRLSSWDLVAAGEVDTPPAHAGAGEGRVPVDAATLDGASAVLRVGDDAAGAVPGLHGSEDDDRRR